MSRHTRALLLQRCELFCSFCWSVQCALHARSNQLWCSRAVASATTIPLSGTRSLTQRAAKQRQCAFLPWPPTRHMKAGSATAICSHRTARNELSAFRLTWHTQSKPTMPRSCSSCDNALGSSSRVAINLASLVRPFLLPPRLSFCFIAYYASVSLHRRCHSPAHSRPASHPRRIFRWRRDFRLQRWHRVSARKCHDHQWQQLQCPSIWDVCTALRQSIGDRGHLQRGRRSWCAILFKTVFLRDFLTWRCRLLHLGPIGHAFWRARSTGSLHQASARHTIASARLHLGVWVCFCMRLRIVFCTQFILTQILCMSPAWIKTRPLLWLSHAVPRPFLEQAVCFANPLTIRLQPCHSSHLATLVAHDQV